MAERVVHVLEVVQVNQQETDRRSVLLRLSKSFAQTSLEEGAVWQLRKRVMVGQPPETLLSLFLVMDVSNRANPFPNRAVVGLQRHTTSQNPAILTILGQN